MACSSTFDQILAGRLTVGAVIAADTSTVRAEFNPVGVGFEKRVGRWVEGFALCHALCAGEPVTWEGRWHLYEATLALVPAQASGPPLWLGVSIPQSLYRASKNYDGFPIRTDMGVFRQGLATLQTAATALRWTLPTAAIYLS